MYRSKLAILVPILLLSCFEEDPPESAGTPQSVSGLCGNWTETLNDCGMELAAEDADFQCTEPEEGELTEVEADTFKCQIACYLDAGCDTLLHIYCSALSDDEESSIGDCYDACEPPPFKCDNGDEIPYTWECDGMDDCDDGEDEPDTCPDDGYDDYPEEDPFVCGDGEEISASWECDGMADCEDGSDEHDGCPPTTYTCSDGAEIPASWLCDHLNDCTDAGDEADCPWTAACTADMPAGTGNGETDDTSVCGQMESKLGACGLGDLYVADDCEEPTDDQGQCYFDCFTQLNCAEVQELFCTGEITGDTSTWYTNCQTDCAPDPFVCADDGHEIPYYYECDKYQDCTDNSDESSCPYAIQCEGVEDPDGDSYDDYGDYGDYGNYEDPQ